MDTPSAAAQLRSYVARILNLREEIAALNADVSEVYKEAVGNGFDKKTLQATVKRAAQAPEAVQEQDALLELYWRAWTGETFAEPPAKPSRARAREEAVTPHDPDTGEVLDQAPAAPEIPSAPSQGLNGGQPLTESSDAVPAADGSPRADLVGQSEQAPDPISDADLGLPDFLIRDKETNRAPWMGREVAA